MAALAIVVGGNAMGTGGSGRIALALIAAKRRQAVVCWRWKYNHSANISAKVLKSCIYCRRLC
jgi:hypothetical protein